MGNRRITAQLKELFGSNPSDAEKLVMDEFSSGKMSEMSLQFFAKGGKTFAQLYDNVDHLKNVAVKECVRAVLLDMVMNHQDRHHGNWMIAPDQDSEGRYGKPSRLVMIDNGYCAGNGELTSQSYGFWHYMKNIVANQYLDKDTIRDLRELRDDIRDKRRRRKIVSDDIRKAIPHDQIRRVADRIDYILSNRDAKKRVKMPNWRELTEWEAKNHPPKHEGRRPDPAHNPFDITGKTDLIDKADKKQGAVEKFRNEGAIQDFLHPLLEHLNRRQRDAMDVMIGEHYEFDKGRGAIGPMRDKIHEFGTRLPKKLANQIFVKQKFHERLGLPAHAVEHLKDDMDHYLNRNLAQEYENMVKEKNVEAYNKMKRGELDREGLRKAVGENIFNVMEDRWLIPKNMRADGMKDKTERMFDNPGQFGWSGSKPKGAVVNRTATDAMSSGPRRQERLKANEDDGIRAKDKARFAVKKPDAKADRHPQQDMADVAKKAAAGKKPKKDKGNPGWDDSDSSDSQKKKGGDVDSDGIDPRLNPISKSIEADEEFLIVME
jgi:hypothetical protein